MAVPGELQGYWEVHSKYGRIKWKELFEPAIELCKVGSLVTEYQHSIMKFCERHIRSEPTLAEILINPITNKLWGVSIDITNRFSNNSLMQQSFNNKNNM